MDFKIGDKVRNKYYMNLIGIISAIDTSYINTIDVHLNDDHMLYECDPDNWELYFEVGDIVKHKLSGNVYRIYEICPWSSNDGWNLERFDDEGLRRTRINISPYDIFMASDTEKSEFYRLKELHEIKEKLDITPLKEDLNKVYGVHMNFAEYYPSGTLLEFSKELMKFKKEKETNNMRKFRIGDVVEHWFFGKGTVIGYEKCLDIQVEFEDYSIKVLHEDSCSLVSRGREFHDLCGRVQNMPKFKQVIYNDPATIIFWEDGTKTVVKCKGEKYDELKGLMMGIVKKVYGLKKFYDIYEDTTKYVTGNKTLLNIEKGLAESVVKDLYGIKKINSKDDIYKVAMADGFYVTTERK